MRTITKKYKTAFYIAVLLMGLSLSACEEYLDKAPEASINEKDVFGNFISFQGYVEEMYGCISDPHKALAGNVFCHMFLADETLSNSPLLWDDGNYWFDQWRFLTIANANYTIPFMMEPQTMRKRIWPLSWYAIRKANLGLEKLELMTDATQEERDIIKGQCLFFRGFFHLELMQFYGGLPYIDRLLSPSEELTLPRLSYKETALKAAKDLEDAAKLLPARWDDTATGKATLGNNGQRISKVHALAFLGKNLLYAASPMMNESSTGNAVYDVELCKQAAVALAEAIKVSTETGAYKLQSWETWTDNFWVWSPSNTVRPGGTEVIMNQMINNVNYTRFTTVRANSPVEFGAGNGRVEVPTQNYIKNYGMENGLPLEDPASGFDANDPWIKRDPRFYKTIVIDGDMMVTSNATAGLPHKYALLYNGGTHKGGTQGSVTGYYLKKYTPLGTNPWDNRWSAMQAYMPRMRLADVYLMYAEAALWGYGSASGSAPGSGLTAEQALNTIRNRAQLPNIDNKFTGTQASLMAEIIRERAVELGFEGLRWFDLRRWNLNGDPKYIYKTAIDFDRGTDGKPINIQERVVVTRVVEKKHNWVPFEVSYTKLYKEWPQNPGW
ncbi:MAG: RagB/SusD family nutrient uptake outer membrane protein [Prolixibacteraceae bacterium]|nr:RagB/SusD family nutrient uptake outer membrane protein [Prolixibacteraceae bacterium]